MASVVHRTEPGLPKPIEKSQNGGGRHKQPDGYAGDHGLSYQKNNRHYKRGAIEY
jgi:hypothetical protein